MKAAIISGGEIHDYDYIRQQIDSDCTIICADSGYDHAARMGLVPHIIVGDFDSISSELPQNIPTLRHNPRKNRTDTEIAVDYAFEAGYRDFLLFGAIGSRMDHSLANILMLLRIHGRGGRAVILNESNKIMLNTSHIEVCEPPGTLLSLLPLVGCSGVYTQGLEYPLHDADMEVGYGLGVSNVITKCPAVVRIAEGTMLVIVARDNECESWQ